MKPGGILRYIPVTKPGSDMGSVKKAHILERRLPIFIRRTNLQAKVLTAVNIVNSVKDRGFFKSISSPKSKINEVVWSGYG